MKHGLTLILLFISSLLFADNTGVLYPSQTGTMYNTWHNPTYAYTDDANDAYVLYSQYPTSQSYSYFNPPSLTGYVITGIGITGSMKSVGVGEYGYISAEISINAASSFTSTGYTYHNTNNDYQTFNLGGDGYLWGLGTIPVVGISNGNFVVKLTIGDYQNNPYQTNVDWIGIIIYYESTGSSGTSSSHMGYYNGYGHLGAWHGGKHIGYFVNKAYIPEEPLPSASDTSTILVWSENWDTDDPQPWLPNQMFGWWYTSRITTVTHSGYGYALNVPFLEGLVGGQDGIGNYRISLDSSYTELYLAYDYYIPSDFDYGGGGKFFAGLAGGTAPWVPWQAWGWPDTSGWNMTHLWTGAGNWNSYDYIGNDSNNYSCAYYEMGGVTRWWCYPNGDYLAGLNKGTWTTNVIRVKLNTADGVKDGIYECYNGTATTNQATMKYARSNKDFPRPNRYDEDKLEQIIINCFYGGTEASPKDQYFQFDNLRVFYYPPGNSHYRSGASESNREIWIPAATHLNPTPANHVVEYAYTDASGTIDSHCDFYYVVGNVNTYKTSTIQISGASYITLTVQAFSFSSGVTESTWKSKLRVYEGTGGSKVLKQLFEYGVYTTVPTVINISGNSATLEYQSGSGQYHGYNVTYTSDGSGSGNNYVCPDYDADQYGIGY